MDSSQYSFQDSVGRTWTIAISAGTCKRIAAKTSVKLLAPDADIEQIFKLVSSPHLLIDVLWICVSGQHDGVGEDEFLSALGGEELSVALQVLKSIIVLWCEQLSPSSGISLRLEKASKFESAKRKKLEELLDSPEVDRIAKEHLDNAYKQGVEGLRELLESQ